jgi:hypothetical protein
MKCRIIPKEFSQDFIPLCLQGTPVLPGKIPSAEYTAGLSSAHTGFSGEFFRFPYIFSEQLEIVQRKSTELKTNV